MPEERAEIAPVAVDRPDRPVALVFDSPHSGRHHPEDFRPAVGPFLLRGSEDGLVDDLFADAPHHGATLVRALFARAYVDPNRAPDDLDPLLLPDEWSREIAPTVHSRRGVGLVFRLVGDAIPIYDRVLSVEELDRRIEAYWRPYHDALDGALDGLQRTFGTVWHVNCHSMQSVGNALSPDPGSRRPDFVLGDLNGRSCAPEFTDFVASALRQARNMAETGRMAHDTGWRRDFATRMRQDRVGGLAAENIAHGRMDVPEVLAMWMNSSGHRRNMLDGRFTRFGLAHAQDGRDGGRRYWAMVLAP
jgi:N-formylglutamate deformylase